MSSFISSGSGAGNLQKDTSAKDEADGPGAASRRQLPRRSKKRANYKEPSDDELGEDDRVPISSKKARLDRDRDQVRVRWSMMSLRSLSLLDFMFMFFVFLPPSRPPLSPFSLEPL